MEEIIKTNSYQTKITRELLDTLPKEVEEDNKWTVYKHTSPSNRVYVGITSIGINNRWNYGRGYKNQKLFNRAIKKYGWENIKQEIVLESISKKHAVYAEKYLIAWYKTHEMSYNMTDGGEGICGYKPTQETIEKIKSFLLSDKNKNRGSKRSAESIEKIKIAHSKKKVYQFSLDGKLIEIFRSANEASRELNMCNINILACCNFFKNCSTANGYIFLWENQLEDLDRRVKIQENKYNKSIKVTQYDMNGNYIQEFNSIREASRVTSIDNRGIMRSAEGKYKHAGGFLWKI